MNIRAPRFSVFFFLFVLLSFAQTSSAAFVSSVLSDVSILGKAYNVTFWADDSPSFGTYTANQSFNSLKVLGNSLEFTSEEDALAATQAIVLKDSGFDWNPGTSPDRTFRVAFAGDDSLYSYRTYGDNFGFAGPFTFSSDSGNVFSLATFDEISAVPIPAAAWLFGSGLMGFFGMLRKKRKQQLFV